MGGLLLGALLGGVWGALLLPALIGLCPWLIRRLGKVLEFLFWALMSGAILLTAGAFLPRLPNRIAPIARPVWEGLASLPKQLPGALGGQIPSPSPRLLLPRACVAGDQALRAAPGGPPQGRVAHGTPIWIIEEGGAWSRIRALDGASGYVPAKALRHALRTDWPLTCVRATERLRLRAGPGTHFPILDRLEPATPLEVLGREGNWIRARTPHGQEGFVSIRWVFWPPLDPAPGSGP